jgi:hypothetical protein
MANDRKAVVDAERLLRLQRYEQQFDQRRMGDPDFARISTTRWVLTHQPWNATPLDNLLAVLGAAILIAGLVAYLAF